jgi:hypothetical protein
MLAASFRSYQISYEAFRNKLLQITSDVYWRYLMSSELMGVTKKAKVTFTCEPDLKKGLEEWAHSESRTLSNLIEMVIRQAYEIRQKPSNPSVPTQKLPSPDTDLPH